jgi:hypothetical protein
MPLMIWRWKNAKHRERRDEGPAGERLTPAARLLVVACGNI